MRKYIVIALLIILFLFIIKKNNSNSIIHTNSNMLNDVILENTAFLEEWNINIIGTLEFPTLNQKFKVADGISENNLNSYIGHIDTTPLFKGNVGMITNNSLNGLNKNDEIKYNFSFGEKTYIVEDIFEINDKYYNYLDDTEDNRLTLIIFAENAINLCIKAKEII